MFSSGCRRHSRRTNSKTSRWYMASHEKQRNEKTNKFFPRFAIVRVCMTVRSFFFADVVLWFWIHCRRDQRLKLTFWKKERTQTDSLTHIYARKIPNKFNKLVCIFIFMSQRTVAFLTHRTHFCFRCMILTTFTMSNDGDDDDNFVDEKKNIIECWKRNKTLAFALTASSARRRSWINHITFSADNFFFVFFYFLLYC